MGNTVNIFYFYKTYLEKKQLSQPKLICAVEEGRQASWALSDQKDEMLITRKLYTPSRKQY